MSSITDPEQRQRLLAAVSSWIDECDEAEPPPAGIAPEVVSALASPAEPTPDLFSLFGQLSALTRETQLQGRATNRLHTELSEILGQLAEQHEQSVSPEDFGQQINQQLNQQLGKQLSQIRQETRTELLAELLEVRDRFTRSLDEAHRRLAGLSGWRARFGQRPVLEALVEGNTLARERLDDLLRRLDVHEIACLNRPFDPTLMRAAEVSRVSTAAPGTVLEIIRPGYTNNGRVVRFAEVKVVAGSPPPVESQTV